MKGQCHDIFDTFFAKKIIRGPVHEPSRFCKDIQSQNSKITFQRSQRLRGHGIFSLRVLKILIIAIFWGFVNTTKYFFSYNCSFKMCEKTSKFAVCMVVSAKIFLKTISLRNLVTVFCPKKDTLTLRAGCAEDSLQRQS